MPRNLHDALKLIETDPEVKSYIYQQLTEFEPFVSPHTVVAVVAKDPLRLAAQLESEGEPVDREALQKMYRIAIILREGPTRIQQEALAEDIYTAIRLAKEKLIKQLSAIQNEIMSHQERVEQINSALENIQIH
ncbi:MAG: HPF/RaiA family ribosome-associated protein [Bdellovibrionaceae bacterium]|nr:HPF/RaiA family ribosome-associated protein [Pseudobdellovibrionaceae bacterium]